MAWGVRVPIQIELDRRPREREDRRQRERLTEEMRRFKEVADKAAEERNRQRLEEQKEAFAKWQRERAAETREAFAPEPSALAGQEAIWRGEAPEEERLKEGGRVGREFREAIERGADPEKLTRIRDVLKEEGVSPEDFRTVLAGRRAELEPEKGDKAKRAVRRLLGIPEPPTLLGKLKGVGARILERGREELVGETRPGYVNIFDLEQKYIAKHTTPKFQAAFRATLGESLKAVGVPEERADQASDIGGVLLGQIALPTSAVPFVGQGSRLIKVLRAVALGAGLAAGQERAFIQEFEGRDPELWELLVAGVAGGGGAGLIESGAIGATFRRLRPGAAAGEVVEEAVPAAARPVAAAEPPVPEAVGPRAAAPGPAEAAPAPPAVEIPPQAVDDFEVIPREAIAESAAQRPAAIGGAGEQFAAPLRDFSEVAGEVVTRDDPIGQALARAGVSPSLLETSDVGRATVAFGRQRGSTEQLINVTLASAVDVHRTGVGRALPIAIGDDAFATLDNGRRMPWNDLFSTNQFDNELNVAQRAFVDDYRRVVQEAEFLRTQAGLKPRATKGKGAAEGWFYIPRQVEAIRGMELRRPASPALQRHYDEAIEGIENGIRYESDPRAVLELHLRQAYREIAEKQLSDYLEPLSITPKALIPEPVLRRMSDATLARLDAERELRAVRTARGRGVRELGGQIERARLDVERARTGLAGTQEVRAAQRRLDQLERQRARLASLQAEKPTIRTEAAAEVARAEANVKARTREYGVARAHYSKALETARKAELAPGNLFGRAEDVIPVAQWRNRFFPLEDAQRLNDALGVFLQSPKTANWAGRGFEQVGNHIRFLSAIGDFAAPFLHGLPLLGRNPVAWARASWLHYVAFADPGVQARFIRDHINTFQEMAAHNVPIGDVEFFKAIREGQGVSAGAMLELLPKGTQARNLLRGVGRQTFGRFQASYDMFLSADRALLWESMKPGWRGSLDDLAAHVRNMTGGLDSRALGVGPTQRGFESTWLAFSPRLLRSTVALIGDLRLGLGNPRGRAAFRSLGGLASGTVGVYIAAGVAMGKSEEEIRRGLNPLEGKKFLSYNINGDWVGVGGQVRAIAQVMARSAADPQSLVSPGQFDNPLLQFAAGRGAPGMRIVQTIGEQFTGADILPYDDIDSLPDMFLHIGQSALPFAIQGLLEGEGATAFVTGLAGARTSPATSSERFKELYREKYGEEPPPDMSARTLDAELAAQAGYTGGTEFQEERAQITEPEEQRLGGLAQIVLRGNPQAMQQFSDELGDYFRFRSGVTDALVQQFDLPERQASLVQAYYNLDPRDRRDPETGLPDYDFFQGEQNRILQQLRSAGATQAARALEEGTGVQFSDPDLQRVYEAQRYLKDGLDAYYETESVGRELFRIRHPDVDAKLYLLGRVSRVVSLPAREQVRTLSTRLLGTTIEASLGEGGSATPGLLPSRRDLLPTGGDGLLPSRRDLLP